MRVLSPWRLIANSIGRTLHLKNKLGSGHRYEVMLAIIQVVNSSLSLHQTLGDALRAISEKLNIDTGMVWLLEEDKKRLKLFAYFHAPQQIIERLKEIADTPPNSLWHLIDVC